MGRRTSAHALLRLAAHPVNYWSGILLDAAVAGGLFVHASRVAHARWMREGEVLLAGLALYGLLEYVVHRWVYHGERSPAAPGHRLHHADPEALIALPCFVTATVELALWAGLRLLLGDAEASVLIAALVTGFLFYAFLHHTLHRGRPSWRYFRVLRGHHRIHHQFPERNFGVTMTVWDWVFGTHYRPMKRREARPTLASTLSKGAADRTSRGRLWIAFGWHSSKPRGYGIPSTDRSGARRTKFAIVSAAAPALVKRAK